MSEELEEVRVLRVQPGDTIVCTLHRHLPAAELDRARVTLEERFPENPVLFLSPDVGLSVARPTMEYTPVPFLASEG